MRFFSPFFYPFEWIIVQYTTSIYYRYRTKHYFCHYFSQFRAWLDSSVDSSLPIEFDIAGSRPLSEHLAVFRMRKNSLSNGSIGEKELKYWYRVRSPLFSWTWKNPPLYTVPSPCEPIRAMQAKIKV